MKDKGKNKVIINNINYTSSENFDNKGSLIVAFIGGGIIGFIFWLIFYTSSGEAGFIFSTVAMGAVCVGYAIQDNNKKTKERTEFLNKVEEKIKDIKETDITYMSLSADLKGILINDKEERVIIYNGLTLDPIEVEYKDILSFELRENGSQQMEGKGASTYLAGKYIGQHAALAVASSARNIEEFCNNLFIEIHSKEINDKNIRITLINNVQVNKVSQEYLALYDFAKNIIVTLDKIMKKVDDKNETNKNTEFKEDNFDKLKKLKELLDSSIITQEEFDTKKKQLLEQ